MFNGLLLCILCVCFLIYKILDDVNLNINGR